MIADAWEEIEPIIALVDAELEKAGVLAGGFALSEPEEGTSITRASARELGLEPGRPVFAIVKSVAFDPHGMGRAAGVVEI